MIKNCCPDYIERGKKCWKLPVSISNGKGTWYSFCNLKDCPRCKHD